MKWGSPVLPAHKVDSLSMTRGNAGFQAIPPPGSALCCHTLQCRRCDLLSHVAEARHGGLDFGKPCQHSLGCCYPPMAARLGLGKVSSRPRRTQHAVAIPGTVTRCHTSLATGSDRYLLLEDPETGDVLMPLIYMKALLEANYSRKLASLKHRVVTCEQGGCWAGLDRRYQPFPCL